MKRLALFAGLMLALFGASFAQAAPLDVRARALPDFGGIGYGEEIGSLVYRGGVELASPHENFGGLSGVTLFEDGRRVVFVTDIGDFVSGRLRYDDTGAPRALAGAEITAIQNSGGAILPRAFARDAEALDLIVRDGRPAAVRVGFENLARLADFALTDGRPGGAATVVSIPEWLTNVRTNESIESVCIASPGSPVAGSTLVITEGFSRTPDTFAATLLGVRDRGDLALAQAGNGFNPTDCVFLPDGDLLVLERAVRLISFSTQIRRIPADQVAAGNTMDGAVIFEAGGAEVDNFEAIGVHETREGEVRLTLVSDDNFRSLQRTLLVQFGLPPQFDIDGVTQ